MPDQQLDRQAAQNVAGFVKSLNLTSDLKPRDWAELADRLADEIHAYEAALAAAAEQERDEGLEREHNAAVTRHAATRIHYEQIARITNDRDLRIAAETIVELCDEINATLRCGDAQWW